MFSLVLKTIRHFHRQLLPVILGVAVACAIITGALIVGDSVRGSLRTIALDRIGHIERIVLAPRWFSVSDVLPAADQSVQLQSLLYISQATGSFLPPDSSTPSAPDESAPLVPTHQSSAKSTPNRANEMSLLGVSEAFWKLGTVHPKKHPVGEQVILNQSLANALQAQVGSQITLRVAANALVPAESVLGKRDADTFVLPRWEVIEIVPDQSLGRFSLRSDQRPVMNAFVDRTALQSALSINGQANAIVAANEELAKPDGLKIIGGTNKATDSKVNTSDKNLLPTFTPKLSDLGFNLERVSIPDGISQSSADTQVAPETSQNGESPTAESKWHYDHITTDQMLISDDIEKALATAVKQYAPQSILTYLANGVEIAQKSSQANSEIKSVPYSTISAVDWSLLSTLLASHTEAGNAEAGNAKAENAKGNGTAIDAPTSEDWVVINQWLADELQVSVGDRLKIDYFLPETVEGTEIEKSFEATVVAIAPITTPKTPYRRNRFATFEHPPTPFNDPHWTPTVPGITDQDSISNWETPFPLKRSINERDDEYWNNHRLTPKLFISYERGKQLFGSRFGNTTSLRFASLKQNERVEVDALLRSTLTEKMPELGWREIPLRDQQLARSGGSTQFDGLFMALSFFVIAAALLLVVLLFRLSIERRANHWGLLAASGWSRDKVRGLLLGEGALLSAVGSTIGIGLGTAYAYAMLSLLKSWWIGAISVSFLDYHLSVPSLIIGWCVGFIAAMFAIYFAARRLKRSEISGLLRGRIDGDSIKSTVRSWVPYLTTTLLLGGIGCLIFGQRLRGQDQAISFIGGGMLLMIAGLMWVWRKLKSPNAEQISLSTLPDLAKSSTKRAATRSILAIAMIAIASFLILSLSLFRASPTELGTGGFTWVGKSSSPIIIELDKSDLRVEHLGQDIAPFASMRVASMRVRGGDDASCNNLYQANEPQVWGITPRIEEIDKNEDGNSRFAWFQRNSHSTSPWTPLSTPADGSSESPIPVILDQNTALWALHLGGFIGEQFSYTFDNQSIHFQTVGVLQNTILQGGLIIGESNFQKVFPNISGYRSFLVHAPLTPPSNAGNLDSDASQTAAVKSMMENGWEEQGLSLVKSESILEQLLAVQNTYLAAFQMLGSLGLLLGTLGLAVTQLRSAYERQSELASMRAIGFSSERITWLLALETAWQLLLGLGIGAGSAFIATLPALMHGQPFSGIQSPLIMLVLILLVGVITSFVSAKLAMRMPLLASLRGNT